MAVCGVGGPNMPVRRGNMVTVRRGEAAEMVEPGSRPAVPGPASSSRLLRRLDKSS